MAFELEPTKVVNSRYFKRKNHIWRRRKHLETGVVFTTRESVDLNGMLVQKRNSDTSESFQPAKLLVSILRSIDHREQAPHVAWQLMLTVQEKLLLSLSENMHTNTSTIGKIVQETLRNFDKAGYEKYVAYSRAKE